MRFTFITPEGGTASPPSTVPLGQRGRPYISHATNQGENGRDSVPAVLLLFWALRTAWTPSLPYIFHADYGQRGRCLYHSCMS